jgi:hypothetical protein
MALRRGEGTEFAEHTNASGTLRAWALAKNVFVTQGEGHMQDDHCAFIEVYGEQRIRRAGGKLYVFHDWLDMTGYDSKTRVRLTLWSVAHRNAYEEVHLAVRSRIVAMGVQVANVPLGGFMRAHTGLASLEVELARVMSLVGASIRPPRDARG